MTTFALLLALAFAGEPDASAPIAPAEPANGVESFTLGDAQLAAGNDFGRVKLTTFSNIGSVRRFGSCDQHWFGATVFSQVGLDVVWNPDSDFEAGTNSWVILRGGVHWSYTTPNFALKQSVQVGAIVLLPGAIAKPQVGYAALATAWDGRFNVLTIHSLSFDVTGEASPGYYYEGYVDGGPWPSSKRAPRLGVFYENTYGPRVGPRLAIGGFYLHVSVIGPPIYYAGYQFVL